MTKERFKPVEYPQVKYLFWKFFGVSVGLFHENMMTAGFAYVVIDMLKFDEWLHNQVGDYEDDGLNFSQVIKNKYGSDALNFVTKII